MPTLDSLQAQLNALQTRVNVIDGQGLTDPSLAVLTVLASSIAGLRTSLRQGLLSLEQSMNTLKASMDQLSATLNTHLNGGS